MEDIFEGFISAHEELFYYGIKFIHYLLYVHVFGVRIKVPKDQKKMNSPINSQVNKNLQPHYMKDLGGYIKLLPPFSP